MARLGPGLLVFEAISAGDQRPGQTLTALFEGSNVAS
jgi:hypothetical protein